jgi:hypothetical protein
MNGFRNAVHKDKTKLQMSHIHETVPAFQGYDIIYFRI